MGKPNDCWIYDLCELDTLFQKALSAYDSPVTLPQLRVLNAISDCGETCEGIIALKEVLHGSTKQNIRKSLDVLSKKGFIQLFHVVVPTPKNGEKKGRIGNSRCLKSRITQDGISAMERGNEILSRFQEDCFFNIDQKDLMITLQTISKIKENLKGDSEI